MTRYELDSGMLDTSEASADPGPMISTARGGDPVGDLGSGARMERWRWALAWALCKVNGCAPTIRRSGDRKRLDLIGRAGHVDTVRYLFPAIARQVEAAARAECRGMGGVYRRNFCDGAVETIRKRLQDAAAEAVAEFKAEAGREGWGLVRVNTALQRVEGAHKAAMAAAPGFGVRYSSGSRSAAQFDHAGREAGRRAGARFSLGGSAGALAGGQRRLPL